jgi:predicted unusual protein kinase regulating ubiquinone biosynthesis (AarF/ABC1/UbiB family)
MATEKKYRPGWRIRKAYTTTTVVIFSYLWLLCIKKLLGKSHYERRLLHLHVINAERVKSTILELNGLFIKVGQLLSILGNFLPEAFQKPLEALQDNVPPRPFSEVQERFLREFGKLPKELFREMDESPVAAASIGQVHRAVLRSGEVVAVKVQHAHIRQTAKVDLEILKKISRLSAWIFNIKGMDFAYTQVREMIEGELDFSREAQSMKAIAVNLSEESKFVIPEVYNQFSTSHILVTAWHEGTKITNLAQLNEWKIDRTELLARLLRIYCRMVFKDGLYHADPHPGNILIKKDSSIVLLDFGAVARLSPALQQGIPQLIDAAVRNDNKSMIAVSRSMGFIAEGREADKTAEKMINALRRFLEKDIKLDGLNLREIQVDPFNNSLLDLLGDIGISGISGTVQVPKDWVLLNRMSTLLVGINSMLDPTLNPLNIIRPYVKQFVMGEKTNYFSMFTRMLRRTASTAVSLPDETHRVLQKIESGEFETRTPDIREGAKLLYQVGQQFVLTLMIIAAGTFGYLFYLEQEPGLTNTGFILAGIFILLLFRSLWKGNRIRRRLDE